MASSELHRTVRDRLTGQGQRYAAAGSRWSTRWTAASGPVTLPELLGGDRSVPQSSAYRNLSVLEQAGVVRRLVHTVGHAHYELAEDLTGHHHHMICESCGVVRDITLAATLERSIDRAFADLVADAGFSPRHHAIDIYGRCADCMA